MSETTAKKCRICLHEITENAEFQVINNDNDLMRKLLEFVPDIDLSFTPNSICCQPCTDTIQQMYELKETCLQSQDIVILDNSILNCITMKADVKEKIVDDQFTEFNTDIPGIIEEPIYSISYICYCCGYRTDNSDQIKLHNDTHADDILMWNKNNFSGDRLDEFNDEKTFKCRICKFSSNYKQSLKLHLKMHNGETLFECKRCNFSTTFKQNLVRHLFNHGEGMQYKCTQCDYKGCNMTSLRRHLLSHADEKPFKCNLCDYSAKVKNHLKSHMISHRPKKRFKCSKCDYSTDNKRYVMVHERNHITERPYKCTLCNYNCDLPGTLTKHLVVHSKKEIKGTK